MLDLLHQNFLLQKFQPLTNRVKANRNNLDNLPVEIAMMWYHLDSLRLVNFQNSEKNTNNKKWDLAGMIYDSLLHCCTPARRKDLRRNISKLKICRMMYMIVHRMRIN